jgi:hypothetical protein
MDSKLERQESRVDLLISLNEHPVLGSGNMLDLGSGDAYMQIYLIYHIWVNHLKDKIPVMLLRPCGASLRFGILAGRWWIHLVLRQFFVKFNNLFKPIVDHSDIVLVYMPLPYTPTA